jgi:Outer membrane protein/protective antigen OMA87
MKFFFLILLVLKFAFTYAFADIINNVEVKNNNRITKETVITFGGIELGKNYSQEQLNDILLDLYSTNFFSDIKFEIQGNTLIVIVDERKIIQQIVLNGVPAEKTKKAILKNLNLREKSPYIKFLAKQDIKKIQNTLNSSGFYFNKVDATVKTNNNDTIDLIYNIELGDKALIKNIIFTGDRYYKDKKLKNIIVSEESKFWKFISNKKYLNPNQIDLDLRLLEKFY